MRAPNAWSRSADPAWDVCPRLPCLAMRTPAPAATKAAVVDMLKVASRSPPVLTMSTRGSSPGM